MATPNAPLQKRAGLNIGIEPGQYPFLQDAGGREVEINPTVGAKTVILECPQGIARTPLTQSADDTDGMIFNVSGADFHYEVWFRDVDGNEAKVADSATVGSGASVFFSANSGYLDDTAFTLTPGEKLLILSVSGLG